MLTTIEPSLSVRRTRAPFSTSLLSVRGDGCPYGLLAPALTTAIRGRMRSRKASVVAVALP